nr:putative ribonuclease H-like domain-containing protein [Tanacetum cinerariifolium]
MTYYSLWEVILNGDSPAPTRVIEGVVQPVSPTTAEQKLAKKNELKAHGTLLMALPDKHPLKFNIHKDAKNLMEAIEKRFGRNKETKKKLISQLEILRESLSQKDINLKFLRSLPTEWRTHTLIWRNKIDLEEQSLDDLFNSLKIYEAKRIRRNLRANGPTSMGFDMSKVECYNCHKKGHFARECRSLKDTRRKDEEPTNYALMAFTSSSSSSNNEVVACSKACTKAYAALQSHNDKLKNDYRKSKFDVISYKTGLESVEARLLVYQQNESVFEKDINLLKLEVQLQDNALVVLRQNLEKAEQDKDDLKLKLEKFQTSSKNLSELLASQTNDKTILGYNTQVFTRSMFDCDDYLTSDSDESLPPSLIYDRYQSGDGYHVVPLPYTETFMPPKRDLVFHNAPNDVETVHTTFNVELSPTKPDKDLSPTPRPLESIIEDWVSDSEDDSEAKIPQNIPSFVQPNEQVKHLRPSVKPVETSIPAANPKTAISKPSSTENSRNRKACFVCKSLTHLIKYLLTQSKLAPITAVRPVTTAVPKPTVTRPRQAKIVVTKPNSPPRRHINRSPSPKAINFPPKVTAVTAPMDKGVISSGCSRHMKGNMSYLSNFEELNGGYVVFGDNPKGGAKFNLFSVSQMCDEKNSVLFTDTDRFVLSFEFKLPDENQVLLRVPRENNMYNVNLKNIVPSRDLTCLFAKATLDESNLWHRRLGHINFKTMNKLVKGSGPTWLFDIDTLTKTINYQPVTAGNQSNPSASVQEQFDAEKAKDDIVQQYVLFPVWSSGSTNPHNTDGDDAFDKKEPEFQGRKPESEVNVSLSSSAQSKKHDDKTKREAKGKSHVESLTGYRNLSVEFEDFFDNSINEVNAVDSPVPAVEQISTNSTNTFSAVGPSNAAVSLTQGKSSYMDSSQLPDDPNMPELEDITYSDDKDDVGTEADFTNLEISTTVSPIPTTRVHKDHYVIQIIGDLSSATQTRSMTRVAKDQGRLSQINNDDYHTCMFACFLLQEEPKRVHQAFKVPSWIKAMQEELLQFKMQKVWVLVNLPYGKRAIGTKWVFRNKTDEKGIVVRNTARLVAQEHTQEEGINYEEVFTPVARIEAIRLFLAYASFMGFMVYQIDVKSAFMYGTIEKVLS